MFISIPDFLTDAEKKAELESAITAVKERDERFETYIERKAIELREWETDLERREHELKGQTLQSTETLESRPTILKQNPSSASINQSVAIANTAHLVQLPAKMVRGRPRKVAQGETIAKEKSKSRVGVVKRKEKPDGTKNQKREVLEDACSGEPLKKEVKKSKRLSTAWTLWYAENKGRLVEEVRAKGIRGSGSVLSLGAKEWNGLDDKSKWEEMALEEKKQRLAERRRRRRATAVARKTTRDISRYSPCR